MDATYFRKKYAALDGDKSLTVEEKKQLVSETHLAQLLTFEEVGDMSGFTAAKCGQLLQDYGPFWATIDVDATTQKLKHAIIVVGISTLEDKTAMVNYFDVATGAFVEKPVAFEWFKQQVVNAADYGISPIVRKKRKDGGEGNDLLEKIKGFCKNPTTNDTDENFIGHVEKLIKDKDIKDFISNILDKINGQSVYFYTEIKTIGNIATCFPVVIQGDQTNVVKTVELHIRIESVDIDTATINTGINPLLEEFSHLSSYLDKSKEQIIEHGNSKQILLEEEVRAKYQIISTFSNKVTQHFYFEQKNVQVAFNNINDIVESCFFKRETEFFTYKTILNETLIESERKKRILEYLINERTFSSYIYEREINSGYKIIPKYKDILMEFPFKGSYSYLYWTNLYLNFSSSDDYEPVANIDKMNVRIEVIENNFETLIYSATKVLGFVKENLKPGQYRIEFNLPDKPKNPIITTIDVPYGAKKFRHTIKI